MSDASDPSDPALLDDSELETWSSLATLLEWLPTALDSQLIGDSEITHFEYGILYALADTPEMTLRMSVLAGYANSSLSRLSRAAARLEKRGWMRRMPDPVDGRFTLAMLTDAGVAKVHQAGPGHVSLVRRLVIDPLTPAQTKQLNEISRRILGAIREDEGWRPAGSVR
jgi:DNA-binding MarR family transcriptional regulator